MQAKMAEQSKNMTPEMWAQFVNLPNPLTQGMSALEKVQEQMAKNAEQMLGVLGLKR
jgi:hypothetical protein